MDSILSLASGMGISQSLLVGLHFARYSKTSLTARYVVCFSICLIFYFAEPAILSSKVKWFTVPIPVFIFLTCRCVFEDKSPIRPWLIISMLFLLTAPIFTDIVLRQEDFSKILKLTIVLNITQILLLIASINVVFKTWADDLIEDRRRVRSILAFTIIAFVLAVFLSRHLTKLGIGFPYVIGQPFHAFEIFMSATLILLVNYLFLGPRRYHMLVMFGVIKVDLPPSRLAPTESTSEIEVSKLTPSRELLVALNSLMTDEKVYREIGLGIGSLAARLGVPEYKLRQTINLALGYRNFNDFLNSYRIKEAAERLIKENDIPVLTIAIEVGFRSMSSFHHAFKERYGVTPAVYRGRENNKLEEEVSL